MFAEAFGDIGEAGGHASMAAATIPLAYAGGVCDREKVPASTVRSVITRFATFAGVDIGDEK